MNTTKEGDTYSDREWKLIHHIDTLTTAVEDALHHLNSRPWSPKRDNAIRRLLQHAIDGVWEDERDGGAS